MNRGRGSSPDALISAESFQSGLEMTFFLKFNRFKILIPHVINNMGKKYIF